MLLIWLYFYFWTVQAKLQSYLLKQDWVYLSITGAGAGLGIIEYYAMRDAVPAWSGEQDSFPAFNSI